MSKTQAENTETKPTAPKETMGSLVWVGYTGSSDKIHVRIVGQWFKGELQMVMSTSSGPKAYMKNMICAAFEARPDIEEIRMFCGPCNTSVPFCAFRRGTHWFDCLGKQISIT